jgi:nitrite reductase/ring-hydroxylating ferredoxin subunit
MARFAWQEACKMQFLFVYLPYTSFVACPFHKLKFWYKNGRSISKRVRSPTDALWECRVINWASVCQVQREDVNSRRAQGYQLGEHVPNAARGCEH